MVLENPFGFQTFSAQGSCSKLQGIFAIKCPSCGCAITTTVKIKHYKRTGRTATYTYLHCTRRKGECDQQPIPLDAFEQQLSDNISQIGIDEEVWSLGIKLLKEKHKYEVEQNSNQRVHLQAKYNSHQDKLNRLIDMRADEEITRDEFLAQKEFLLQEQAKIKERLEDSEGSAHNWLELAENFLNTAFRARDLIKNGNPDEKKNLIMAVGKNFFLRDKNLEFSFKKPYDILLQPDYRTNGLPNPEIPRATVERLLGAFENVIQMGLIRVRWEEIKRLQAQPVIA